MRTIRGAWRNTTDATALVTILASYWTTVFPVVRRELARWRACALAIPDPATRALAMRTLDEEGGLAEGAAIFATLVPGRAARRDLIRLLVAWQVAYDYLDTIGEESSAPSSERAALYRILGIALSPAVRHDGHVGDGGYLDQLVGCCRTSIVKLPSSEVVGPFAVRAAERCCEAQALTHAVASSGPKPLRRWAQAQPGSDGYLWWEVAAGAISSLAVHALLASAAFRDAGVADATKIDAAYFPSICALSTLLDSTIDAVDDAGTTNHRCTSYYADADEAAQRIMAIARIAVTAARGLPHGRGHTVILAGMSAYYAATGWNGNERIHRDVAAAVGFGAGPIMWTLRVRARLRRSSGASAASSRDARRLRGGGDVTETAGARTGAADHACGDGST
jgi:tetraprenyl-beta-curcumene synthase